MLIAPDKRIFVGRRIDTPGAWQMPQGGIDKGETPRDAAMRELNEEVGTNKAEIIAETRGWLAYELPGDLHLQAGAGAIAARSRNGSRCASSARTRTSASTRISPEFDAWKWATREEVLRDIVEFKRPLYEAVLGEFATLFDKS